MSLVALTGSKAPLYCRHYDSVVSDLILLKLEINRYTARDQFSNDQDAYYEHALTAFGMLGHFLLEEFVSRKVSIKSKIPAKMAIYNYMTVTVRRGLVKRSL